jgi:hypothetical protein
MRNEFSQLIQTAVDRLLDVEPENDPRDNMDMLSASKCVKDIELL